ncbi:MAG: hypothetical protein ACR2N5_01815 [Solirubrobacterales bacterium]
MTDQPQGHRMQGSATASQGWGKARLAAGAVAFAFAVTMAAPISAGAATDLGHAPGNTPPFGCGPGTHNFVQVSSVQPVFNYEVPSAGVITNWKHVGRAIADPGTGRLQIWRPKGGTSYELVGRSDLESFTASVVNSYPTQISVLPGDLLGLRTSSTAACGLLGSGLDTASSDGSGTSDPVTGETRSLSSVFPGSILINVAATHEPDADGDGLGDETQDIELAVDLKNRLSPGNKGFAVKSIACGGPCDATVKGKAIAVYRGGASATSAKKKTFKLKATTISVDPGKKKKALVKLKKHSKNKRKLGKLLRIDGKKGNRSKLKLKISASNSFGASDKTKDQAKLKP